MTAPVALNAEAARNALRQVKDPELDMNIIDLGLVYDVEVDDAGGGLVRITMTLTSPGCPAGPMITNDIYKVVRAIDGVKDVDIDIVWEPYWTPDRIDQRLSVTPREGAGQIADVAKVGARRRKRTADGQQGIVADDPERCAVFAFSDSIAPAMQQS